ncbi:MAG: aminopeptidase, partial [Fusobacteria bacterium]|nr:aminopeptidase [Fusobacteriota bacterium]
MSIKVLNTVDRAYDVFIVPKFEGKVKLPECITGETRDYLTTLIAKKEFTGKKETYFKAEVIQNGKVSKIIYIGMGKIGECDKRAALNAYYKVFRRAKGEIIFIANDVCAATVAESFLYSLYDFDTYKSEKSEHAKTLTLVTEESESIIREVEVVVEGVTHTRELVNEPANVIYPETLAKYAVKLGEEYGFQVEVFDESYAQKLGMHAFLAVAQASKKRPKLIVMRYFGAGKENPEVIGLVGKGLTYDTGGLCIKPPEGMKGMKDDMGGSATVMGVMAVISKMKLQKNVVAVVAACENAIGGNAFRPGDIISSMKGISI